MKELERNGSRTISARVGGGFLYHTRQARLRKGLEGHRISFRSVGAWNGKALRTPLLDALELAQRQCGRRAQGPKLRLTWPSVATEYERAAASAGDGAGAPGDPGKGDLRAWQRGSEARP